MRKLQVIIIIFLLTTSSVIPQVVQFRGSDRSGNYPDINLLNSWPENGPEKILEINGFGVGHSSPSVYNEKIYISGKKDKFDVLSAFCMDGKLLWEEPFGEAWYASYPDTRSTPTIENNRIYISSGMGQVNCLDAITGDVIWKKNPHEEFKGKFGSWGMAESMLLTDKAVIVSVGGEEASVVALSKENGELLWKSPPTEDARAYVSPLMIERNGQEIILVVLSENIFGINPDNGEIFWSFNIRKGFTSESGRNRRNNTNTPLYKNGNIFITSGYDATAVMLSLSEDGRSVKLKWKNDDLDTHHGGVVEVDGYIYGSNWHSNAHGNWVCVNWETGKTMYETEWHNKGQIIFADGHLYCKEERNGNVALVPASPSGFNVTSEFCLGDMRGPFWSHPVIHKGKLLIRQGDELMVYDITKK